MSHKYIYIEAEFSSDGALIEVDFMEPEIESAVPPSASVARAVAAALMKWADEDEDRDRKFRDDWDRGEYRSSPGK